MARTESAILKLVDLSATKATPSAHGSQAAEGLLRFETETERGRTMEPLRGTNGSRRGTPGLEEGLQGAGNLEMQGGDTRGRDRQRSRPGSLSQSDRDRDKVPSDLTQMAGSKSQRERGKPKRPF